MLFLQQKSCSAQRCMAQPTSPPTQAWPDRHGSMAWLSRFYLSLADAVVATRLCKSLDSSRRRAYRRSLFQLAQRVEAVRLAIARTLSTAAERLTCMTRLRSTATTTGSFVCACAVDLSRRHTG